MTIRQGELETRVAGWTRIPAVLAPVALIGGWTVAAQYQPGYSPIASTISDLAATTARMRWIMTTGFVVAGLSLVAVAYGLRPVRRAGRVAILLGGLGVLGVAAFPLPANEPVHALAAFVALTALAVWPILGRSANTGVQWLSRRRARFATWTAITLLVILELAPSSSGIGGAVERLAAGGEVLLISFAVFACRRES